ncbi:MAG: non-homologous end-joining DNA ligase [Cyclobacteriaceae bacterium]|nr:non-homologous end-joining DNA ligase [Cyclobacteriaceae bacterium]
MARKSNWTSIGKRKIELSNLDKVLYPDDHILKAEVIEYYLRIAPTILQHIKGRALTLVRYPDGITGEMFFQKNRPEWAPDWIEFATLGSEEKKDYIIATETATLVWLANLAALELHQLHARKPDFNCPDYLVFDLDPPEGYAFIKVVELAFDLKAHLEKFGYTPFVKTTGGKGIHILCPVEPRYDFHTAFETSRQLAQPFTEVNSSRATLHIKKEARKGRILIDIYRMRAGQSIVSPYSLRGRPGAPVSMPITWQELEKITDPKIFNLHTVPDKIIREGDAWQGMDAFAVPLHTQRITPVVKELSPSEKRKSPQQLKEYQRKRDFSKTPEPQPSGPAYNNNRFVIHRHHASHLHYDLRLEQDGVLKSWAVPKGLPPYPGIKRLAVQTEDHPPEYLNFDGTIPKGQYGGGEMWIFSAGKYQITKKKKDGFYFRLSSTDLSAEFRMHQTRGKEFLLERVDEPQVNFLRQFNEPMLAELTNRLPDGEGWTYEVKWDGIRAMITLDEGRLTIYSRNGRDITDKFPELIIPQQAFRAANGVFDTEIVCLDNAGRPEFKNVIRRLMATGSTTIQRMVRTQPVYCYAFDCLYLDGRSLLNDPLHKRRTWLKDVLRKDTPYRFSEEVEEGTLLLEAAREHHLEGIMAKHRDSKYHPGKRSSSWLKVKIRNTADCFIIGFTPGKGSRKDTFGGLHIAEYADEKLLYRGKVGTGFDEITMKEINRLLKTCRQTKKPVPDKITDEKSTVWVEPKLVIEITYASRTPDGSFREPVFERLRPDLMS